MKSKGGISKGSSHPRATSSSAKKSSSSRKQSMASSSEVVDLTAVDYEISISEGSPSSTRKRSSSSQKFSHSSRRQSKSSRSSVEVDPISIDCEVPGHEGSSSSSRKRSSSASQKSSHSSPRRSASSSSKVIDSCIDDGIPVSDESPSSTRKTSSSSKRKPYSVRRRSVSSSREFVDPITLDHEVPTPEGPPTSRKRSSSSHKSSHSYKRESASSSIEVDLDAMAINYGVPGPSGSSKKRSSSSPRKSLRSSQRRSASSSSEVDDSMPVEEGVSPNTEGSKVVDPVALHHEVQASEGPPTSQKRPSASQKSLRSSRRESASSSIEVDLDAMAIYHEVPGPSGSSKKRSSSSPRKSLRSSQRRSASSSSEVDDAMPVDEGVAPNTEGLMVRILLSKLQRRKQPDEKGPESVSLDSQITGKDSEVVDPVTLDHEVPASEVLGSPSTSRKRSRLSSPKKSSRSARQQSVSSSNEVVNPVSIGNKVLICEASPSSTQKPSSSSKRKSKSARRRKLPLSSVAVEPVILDYEVPISEGTEVIESVAVDCEVPMSEGTEVVDLVPADYEVPMSEVPGSSPKKRPKSSSQRKSPRSAQNNVSSSSEVVELVTVDNEVPISDGTEVVESVAVDYEVPMSEGTEVDPVAIHYEVPLSAGTEVDPVAIDYEVPVSTVPESSSSSRRSRSKRKSTRTPRKQVMSSSIEVVEPVIGYEAQVCEGNEVVIPVVIGHEVLIAEDSQDTEVSNIDMEDLEEEDAKMEIVTKSESAEFITDQTLSVVSPTTYSEATVHPCASSLRSLEDGIDELIRLGRMCNVCVPTNLITSWFLWVLAKPLSHHYPLLPHCEETATGEGHDSKDSTCELQSTMLSGSEPLVESKPKLPMTPKGVRANSRANSLSPSCLVNAMSRSCTLRENSSDDKDRTHQLRSTMLSELDSSVESESKLPLTPKAGRSNSRRNTLSPGHLVDALSKSLDNMDVDSEEPFFLDVEDADSQLRQFSNMNLQKYSAQQITPKHHNVVTPRTEPVISEITPEEILEFDMEMLVLMYPSITQKRLERIFALCDHDIVNTANVCSYFKLERIKFSPSNIHYFLNVHLKECNIGVFPHCECKFYEHMTK